MQKKQRTSRLRVYLLMLVLLTALMFSSFGKGIDTDERALVHAIGIDPLEEGGYRVSMQIFKSSGSGSDTPIDPSQPNVQVIACEGATVGEAIERAGNQIGRQIFLGHLQLVCFNRSTDFSNPQELFQFALNEQNVYLGVKICLSETTAEDIINAQLTRGALSAEAIKKVLDLNVKNGVTLECEMIDFLSLTDSSQSIGVPVIASQSGEEQSGGEQSGEEQSGGQQQDNSEPQIIVTSTALIKSGRALDEDLDRLQSQAAAWLTKGAQQGTLTVMHRGELIDVLLTRDDINIKLYIQDGRVVYRASVTLVAHSSKKFKDAKQSQELSDEVEEKISEMLISAENTAITENRADILGIWQLLRHSYPKTYLAYKDELDSIYDMVEFENLVNIRVE